ncbi:MAG: signal peptidase I [Opitutaceae bacterium]
MSKLQKEAKELLQSAAKIYHYRRDVTSEVRLQEFDKAVEEVETLYKSGEDAKLKSANKRLHGVLGKIGGKMYPKGFLNDNIEVALVAAILVIGVRTFFFQPFIIPTNSMYPTYNGMTSSVYEKGEESPSAVKKWLRLATFGARHRTLTANASGDLTLLFVNNPNSNQPAVKSRVRTLGPLTADQYLFSIGGIVHELNVPKEFDLMSLLKEKFDIDRFEPVTAPGSQNIVGLKIADNVVAGEEILKFDVLLGDALFVDRLSYHFIKPKAGDPFVFRTDPILKAVGDATGDYTPKYYIKRIGGVEGETLEIKDSTLLVDGQPRDEVEAYGRNAAQEGEYSGYVNHGLLSVGREMNIPEDHFVALGDNSANSADSRYWGFVPEKAVIGRAIFIYYPFTKRWGVAE